MLAKIHFRTACGCTREIFESDSEKPFPLHYRVPILASHFPFREPGPTPTEAYGVRDFCLVNCEYKSKYIIELWYEEVVYA